jgi:organic hydroperoxide reductase OsmC/OhrA
MLLMAAVGNCLAASLAFALRKFKNENVPLRSSVEGRVMRNEQGRQRMHSIDVVIHLGVPAATLRLAQRAIDQFEDFCVVTQSVRAAIPVAVRIVDSAGMVLAPQRS